MPQKEVPGVGWGGPRQALWHSLAKALPIMGPFFGKQAGMGRLTLIVVYYPTSFCAQTTCPACGLAFFHKSVDLISLGFKNTPGVTSHTAPKVASSTFVSSACPGHLLSWWNCPQGRSLPMQFSCLFSFCLGSVTLRMVSPLRKGLTCFFFFNSSTFLSLVQPAFSAGCCQASFSW